MAVRATAIVGGVTLLWVAGCQPEPVPTKPPMLIAVDPDRSTEPPPPPRPQPPPDRTDTPTASDIRVTVERNARWSYEHPRPGLDGQLRAFLSAQGSMLNTDLTPAIDRIVEAFATLAPQECVRIEVPAQGVARLFATGGTVELAAEYPNGSTRRAAMGLSAPPRATGGVYTGPNSD